MYHEGDVKGRVEIERFAPALKGGNGTYEVRRGRYGGWRDYAGQERVFWNHFRYGKSSGGVDLDTFTGIVCGVEMSVPGSYGHVQAEWTRVDICGERPLSAIYWADREKNPEVSTRLYDSFDFVVRYFEDEDSGFRDNRVVGYVFRGSMYSDIDWEDVRKRGNRDLIEFVGSPEGVDDFISEWWGHTTMRRGEIPSHLWAADIASPRVWKDAFCEANDAFDVFFSDWVDGADVVRAAAELIAPSTEDTGRGVIAGIRMDRDNRPLLRVLVEFPMAMTATEFVEFMAGPIYGATRVVGDDQVKTFVNSIKGIAVTPVFHRTMTRYSEFLYG